MQALLRSPPGWFTVLFAGAVLAYFTWLHITGEAKLRAAGLPQMAATHDVEIVLSVSAEQFHMTRLQSAGRLIRFEDRSAFVLDLPAPALEQLARNYWVAEIRPWAGP
jgi:hypothetical protein